MVCPDCNIEDSLSSKMRREIAGFCCRIQSFQGFQGFKGFRVRRLVPSGKLT